jgi:L,D-peptidoglycan transpeptidase YkuD (ErfK/YbiS/YcfS/YnhG family)
MVVKHTGPDIHSGVLEINGTSYQCALGKAGIIDDKREGDGGTPRGAFKPRELWYRSDRLPKPETGLPIREITPSDGWADDVNLPEYNRHVTLPYQGSHESLWREDHVYDLIIPISYNDEPPVAGLGSAIFIHIAREGYTPTAGCIALKQEDLLKVLQSCNAETTITIK